MEHARTHVQFVPMKGSSFLSLDSVLGKRRAMARTRCAATLIALNILEACLAKREAELKSNLTNYKLNSKCC